MNNYFRSLLTRVVFRVRAHVHSLMLHICVSSLVRAGWRVLATPLSSADNMLQTSDSNCISCSAAICPCILSGAGQTGSPSDVFFSSPFLSLSDQLCGKVISPSQEIPLHPRGETDRGQQTGCRRSPRFRASVSYSVPFFHLTLS